MMKNETEGAQLIITAASDVSDFTLTPVELSDNKGNVIPVRNIAVYQQKYMEILRKWSTNNEFKAGSFVPDMLLPMETAAQYGENTIAAGKNQGITVEITTTRETVPGVYSGTFELSIDGENTEIPVRCEVWDIEYEGRRSFQSAFLLYRHSLLNGEYDNSPETIDAYIDFLLKYKVNTYVIQSEYPVEEFRKEVVRLFANENYNSIVIPVNFELSYDAETSATAEAAKEYIKVLADLSTEEKPYIDYALFYPSNVDEADYDTGAGGGSAAKMAAAYRFFSPGGEIEKTLRDAVSEVEAEGILNDKTPEFAEHIKQAILDIPSVFTNVGFVEDAVKNLDAAFCPYISIFDDSIQAEKYKEQAERVDGEIWTYTCSGPLYPYPSFHTDDYALGARVAGWMEKKYDVSGYLYWSVAYYSSANPDTQIDVYKTAARYATANGDGYLLYPGKYYGSSSPFASVRLTAYRDSMDDYDMLCVYEKLLNEYAEKYGIDNLCFENYVADLYDSLFDGAMYYTDDALLYEARNKLAKRILMLKNDDELLVKADMNGFSKKIEIYTTAENIVVDGKSLQGELSKGGYRYTVIADAAESKTLSVVTENGTYEYTPAATAAITDFGNDGVSDAVCSGREDDPSTMSSIVADGDKAKVMIRSYYAKGSGYPPVTDGHGIDGATQRLMPSVTFPVNGLKNAENIYFTVKNLGETPLEIYIQLVMSNGLTDEIGTAYCSSGEKEVRIHINQTLGRDLSEVSGIRIAFKNVSVDANGYMALWEDRTFELSDLWYDKKSV